MGHKLLSTLGVLAVSVTLLTGCTVTSPEPTPTKTSQTVKQATETKVDVALGSGKVAGVQYEVKQTGYGLATQGQVDRWFNTSETSSTEKPTTEPKLVTGTEVVSLQYTIKNNSGAPVTLTNIAVGFGYWTIPGGFIPPEGETLNPKDNDLGFMDTTEDSLHNRIGYPSYPDGSIIQPGDSGVINIDLWVPRPIVKAKTTIGQFVSKVSYDGGFSDELTYKLTLGK